MTKDANNVEGTLWGRVLYALFSVVGHLPGWWHYFWSWVFSLVMQYLLRYRKWEIESGLRESFPHLSRKEHRRLVRATYLNITDIGVEMIRMCAFSPKQLRKRVKLHNAEVIEQLRAEGAPSLFMFLGHYGNWEWLTGLQLYLPMTQFYILYKHQHGIWHYITTRIRTKFGAKLIEQEEAARAIIKHAREQEEFCSYIFVADQAPPLHSTQLFTQFLGRTTAVYNGMERLAKFCKSPVLYIDIQKPKRGRYEATVKVLTLDAAREPSDAVALAFMDELEETILRAPQYWLWSHRRWKHSIEQVRETFPRKEVVVYNKEYNSI